MPRYIDADALIAEYDRVHIGPAGGARKLMVDAPTADVVPRSEVEELKKAYANYEETSGLKQAKDELARTIFEEIEKLLHIGLVEHVNCIDAYVKKGYTELKKKYVTDTNDGTKVSSGDICVVCGEHVPEGRQICSMCETGQEFLRKRRE